jgi:hypothetical protein
VRIASLLPAATEIVTALGAADQLVAVSFECAAEARERCPVVVDTAIPVGLAPAEIDAWVRDRVARDLPMYELDREALAALEPDLILTQDLCRVCALPAGTVEEACRLIGTDAEVLSVDPHTLDDVLRAIECRRPRSPPTFGAGWLRWSGPSPDVRGRGCSCSSGPIRRSSPGTGCRNWCPGPAASQSVGRRADGA